MIRSANKKRKKIIYNLRDLVFLFSRNIKIIRPLKKLNNKILGPFKILKVIKTFYRLQLPTTMRIHDVFYLSLLQRAAEDPLPE
jgi:hypothetical protein